MRTKIHNGDVAQLVEYRTGMPLRQVRFPSAARFFFPKSHFSVQTLLRCLYPPPPPSTITCINICMQVKDPVVNVRVQRIMETLKHPACIIGWVARLCRSWLSLGKATQIFHGRDPIGTI